MNMKKIFSGLLAVAGVAMFAGAAGAEDAAESTKIRFQTVELTETSETVEIEVYIENNPGFVSATIPVTWDETVLKLMEIQDYHTTVTSGWAGYSEYTKITDTYYLAWNNDTIHGDNYSEYNFTVDGKLCTMVFELLDAAQTETMYAISADLEDPLASMMNWDMEDYLNQKEDDGIYGLTIEFIDGGIMIGAPEEYTLGDVNEDGKVNTLDRMKLARHLANWDGYKTIHTQAADIDGDGSVSTVDRTYLARHLAKWVGYEDLASFRTGN